MNSTKTVTIPVVREPSLKPDGRVIGFIIKALEGEGVEYSNLKELSTIISKRFKVDVTEDDLFEYFTPYFIQKDAELTYRRYGYGV